jgi:short-subunit dehydrogenase
MKSLTNQIIWITGASSGIGEALAYELSKAGAKLILSSRRKEELVRVKNNCKNPEKIKVLLIDLADKANLTQITKQAIQIYGRLDILINNAGISQRSLVAETLLSVDRQIMEVNYFANIALTKSVLQSMLDNKSGHIVNISSLVGKFGTPYRSAYAASKHALHGFYDSMRAELWSSNIKVTLICPGFIKTNVSINALDKEGNKTREMDDAQANGMLPEVAALKIIKAIKKEKEEVFIGGKEVYAVYLKRFLPSLFSKIIKKAKTR